MVKGSRWGGVPPAGNKPIVNRWSFLVGLIGVILVEWILWAVYRYLSLPIIENAFTRLGFLFHILAAPLIGLIPIVVYWKYIMKEKGLPWRFTGKNLFTSVTVGAASAAILMVLYQVAQWAVLVISGQADPSSAEFISLWRSSIVNGDLDWFILMTFTFFFIVGPVEELQYRSFLQDQIGRAFTPATGLLIASSLFALSHLPIYIIVYGLSPVQVFFTLCWTFTMGSVLGVFYFQSRNILGPIIMHGFWDWVLSVWVLDVRVKGSYLDLGYVQEILWLAALIPMALITLYLINIMYSAFWKGDRKEKSFGLGPIGFLSEPADRLGSALSGTSFFRMLKKMDSPRLSFNTRVARSSLSVIIIALLTMLLSTPGTLVLEGNLVLEAGGGPYFEDSTSIFSYAEGIYVREGDTEELEIRMNGSWLVIGIKATIFWADENPPGFRFTNMPDSFSSTFLLDGEEMGSLGPVDTGSIIHNWVSDPFNVTGHDARLTITCEDAGDIEPIFDPVGLRRRTDEGNDVTISLQIEYIEKPII